MNIREAVEEINRMPTMLVDIRFGENGQSTVVVARPAEYDEVKKEATLYYYYGPLDPEKWAKTRDASMDREGVEESHILEAMISSVRKHESVLDTTPLRFLPLWAKEQWVKQTENDVYDRQTPDWDVKIGALNGMKRLIEEERNGGGLRPKDMTLEMQGRYLRIDDSLGTIENEAFGKPNREKLEKLLEGLNDLMKEVPKIRELPWRNEEGLYPGSFYNRQDFYEMLLDILQDAMHWLVSALQSMIMAERGRE